MHRVTEHTSLRLRSVMADLKHVRSLLDELDAPCVASARLIVEQSERQLRSAEAEVEGELDERAAGRLEERYGLTVTGMLALRERVAAD